MTKIHISLTINPETWKEFDTTAKEAKRTKSDLMQLLMEKVNTMSANELLLFLHDINISSE